MSRQAVVNFTGLQILKFTHRDRPRFWVMLMGLAATASLLIPVPAWAVEPTPQLEQSGETQPQSGLQLEQPSSPLPGLQLEQPQLQPSNSSIPQEDSYTLGAGDAIQIDIFDVPEFSGETGRHTIPVDGTLNLPWIGKVPVQGLTLEQAAEELSARYARYIHDPRITVTLLSPRPMRIGIVGQVRRPGVYTVSQTSGSSSTTQTVTSAIQAAGGITETADIRTIQVQRPDRFGQQELINVDLWSFLQSGNLAQDVTLRDGDTVVIAEATEMNPAEVAQLAAANFSPATITVNVVGEVVTPGAVTVPPNTSLNQALLASGGFNSQRARRDSVSLIRLNPDGTASKRSVHIDFSANVNEATNPPLRANDIIVVGRSPMASTSDFLGSILSPLNGVFGILRLFGL